MELGSEFHLDLSQLTDTSDTIFAYLKEFYTIYTDSGRSALRLLSGRLSGETVLVPDYICGSVLDALPKDCHVIHYPVDRFLCIDTDQLDELIQEYSPRFLYLMHYFGTLQQSGCMEHIAVLKREYHLTVIEDTTHSLFTRKLTVGDYGIASLRKWFPIPDGGVLYTKKEQLLPGQRLEKRTASRKVEAMLLKKLYLTEGFDCNEKYRDIFVKEEKAFDCQADIYGMSDMAHFLLSHYPVDRMCMQRRRNAVQLLEGLRRMKYEAAITVQPADVLLTLPIYVMERDCLRGRLMEHNIYCAVHWPLEHPAVYRDTEWIGAHILSLPMDQRYQEKEIEYLVKCLDSCKKETGLS